MRSDQKTTALVLLLWLATWYGVLGTSSAAQTFKIAGTIVSTDGHPLDHARVTIADAHNRRDTESMLSTDDGHFEFTGLPAGKFSLTGQKRGFMPGAYDSHGQFSTAIVTGAGIDTEHLFLRISPLAQIYGRVLDEHGEPVRNARITLWRDDHSAGISRTIRFHQDQSDDIGGYEFAPIPPGTYFISVSGNPWYAIHPPSQGNLSQDVDRSLDVVYPTTYYPGATESADATPILVRGGDRLELDLHLLPVQALHVIFHPPNPGPNNYVSPMLFKHVFDDIEVPDREPAQVDGSGNVEMVTAPGRYRLSIPGNGRIAAQTADVDIAQDNQELELSGDSLSTVSFLVEIQGESKMPPILMVALRDPKGSIAYRQTADPAGSVTFEDVSPGKYSIVAVRPNNAYSILSIAPTPAAGAPPAKPLPNQTLDIPANANLSFSVTLLGGATTVEGFVKHDGKAVAGAMVVLVPKKPDSNRELFRRDQSDLDGSFSLANVVPGAYTIVAIEDGWELDWSHPATIARYTAHGTHVTVPAGATKINLSDSIDSQIK